MLLSAVSAEKIDIKTSKETFAPGENITFTISLYNDENVQINSEIKVTFESPNKRDVLEFNIPSNIQSEISLGENPVSGYWKIIAKYNNIESNTIFFIEESQLASFSLEGDTLTIKNTGNVIYAKNINFIIGDTTGTKEINLNIGKETSFRLMAPKGAYSVKISDGKTNLTRSEVSLTGSVIGIIDKSMEDSSSPITGINPERDTGLEQAKPKNFVYIFIGTLLAAAVLLTIERRYRKKL